MRLPVVDGIQENIDFLQLYQVVDEFLENGFTYLDTSVYHNGKSEDALRRAVVERYPREKFTIATKFPTFAVQTEDQVEGIFAQQLQNLGTDYVDYYLLHILNTRFYNGTDGKGGERISTGFIVRKTRWCIIVMKIHIIIVMRIIL